MAKVLAGDYINRPLKIYFRKGVGLVYGNFDKHFMLDKETIQEYEEITEQHYKSTVGSIAKGAIGVALLGPIGALAGLTGKEKTIHRIAIKFKDGKNSLIELSDIEYQEFIKKMF